MDTAISAEFVDAASFAVGLGGMALLKKDFFAGFFEIPFEIPLFIWQKRSNRGMA